MLDARPHRTGDEPETSAFSATSGDVTPEYIPVSLLFQFCFNEFITGNLTMATIPRSVSEISCFSVEWNTEIPNNDGVYAVPGIAVFQWRTLNIEMSTWCATHTFWFIYLVSVIFNQRASRSSRGDTFVSLSRATPFFITAPAKVMENRQPTSVIRQRAFAYRLAVPLESSSCRRLTQGSGKRQSH